jgi:hypothetical protein
LNKKCDIRLREIFKFKIQSQRWYFNNNIPASKSQWIISPVVLFAQQVARRFLEVNLFALCSAIESFGLPLLFCMSKYILEKCCRMRRLFGDSKPDQSIMTIRFLQMFAVFFLASSRFIPLICFPTPYPPHIVDHSFALWNVVLTRTHSPSPCPIHLDHYVCHAGCILSSGEYCFLNHTLDFLNLYFEEERRRFCVFTMWTRLAKSLNKLPLISFHYIFNLGYAVVQLVEALRYKP